GARRNRLSCGPLREVGTPSIVHGSARTFSRSPEQPVEGTFERAPHLRALQSRDAAGRDSCDLQAQPQAYTAPGLRRRMARIAGVDLPRDKKIQYALPYSFGIGPSNLVRILAETGISPDP